MTPIAYFECHVCCCALQFVRDGAGMLIGMLELGPPRWAVARSAMRFMLHGLQCTQNAELVPGCSVALNMSRPPEVLRGDCPESARAAGKCKFNTKIIGVDANEETDGAFYVISAWGRIVTATNDTQLEEDFFPVLKTYMDFYFPPPSSPSGSSSPHAYWNATLGLLWTPHLEHSRLTRMRQPRSLACTSVASCASSGLRPRSGRSWETIVFTFSKRAWLPKSSPGER